MKFSAIVPSATVVPLVDIQTGYTLMPRVCPKKNETIKEENLCFIFRNQFFYRKTKKNSEQTEQNILFLSLKHNYTISISFIYLNTYM